jgi:glycosyltransferase involved in cell wall biosynthesis
MFVEARIQEFGIAPEQTTHLPYCADDDQAAMDEATGRDEGYVLYFGRLSREKGLATLIAAMAQLPHLELRLVGDGSLRDDLERKTADLGLSNVRFHRHCEGGDLQRLVARARVSVLPSEWYEVFGQSIVESLLLSTPVVASRIGGIPEVMDDGEHGLLVPPGDAEALADAISWVASHRATADEMGKAGRETAVQLFSAERHYEGLSALYCQASL